jgi:cyclopropane fatty-acyl-phospholipid synthase-like methyltransferase
MNLRALFARTRYLMSERYHDWKFNVSTRIEFTSKALGYASEEYQGYTSTDYRSFERVMRHVSVRAGHDIFLDYGSGSGRVLLMAAGYPFLRVIGVELSPMLNQQAILNVETCSRHLCCKDIQIIPADATCFIPPADVTIMYFYSPFGQSVLRQVLDRIHESLESRTRQLQIIYKNPRWFEVEAAKRPWLRKRLELAEYSPHKYVIYESSTNYL